MKITRILKQKVNNGLISLILSELRDRSVPDKKVDVMRAIWNCMYGEPSATFQDMLDEKWAKKQRRFISGY